MRSPMAVAAGAQDFPAGTSAGATPRFLWLVPLVPILAGFSSGAGGFYDARNISTAGPRPGKGTSRETPDSLSRDTSGWTLHFLQRSRAERRTAASPTARTPVFFADVRAPLHPAF